MLPSQQRSAGYAKKKYTKLKDDDLFFASIVYKNSLAISARCATKDKTQQKLINLIRR